MEQDLFSLSASFLNLVLMVVFLGGRLFCFGIYIFVICCAIEEYISFLASFLGVS